MLWLTSALLTRNGGPAGFHIPFLLTWGIQHESNINQFHNTYRNSFCNLLYTFVSFGTSNAILDHHFNIAWKGAVRAWNVFDWHCKWLSHSKGSLTAELWKRAPIDRHSALVRAGLHDKTAEMVQQCNNILLCTRSSKCPSHADSWSCANVLGKNFLYFRHAVEQAIFHHSTHFSVLLHPANAVSSILKSFYTLALQIDSEVAWRLGLVRVFAHLLQGWLCLCNRSLERAFAELSKGILWYANFLPRDCSVWCPLCFCTPASILLLLGGSLRSSLGSELDEPFCDGRESFV